MPEDEGERHHTQRRMEVAPDADEVQAQPLHAYLLTYRHRLRRQRAFDGGRGSARMAAVLLVEQRGDLLRWRAQVIIGQIPGRARYGMVDLLADGARTLP